MFGYDCINCLKIRGQSHFLDRIGWLAIQKLGVTTNFLKINKIIAKPIFYIKKQISFSLGPFCKLFEVFLLILKDTFFSESCRTKIVCPAKIYKSPVRERSFKIFSTIKLIVLQMCVCLFLSNSFVYLS